MHLLLYNRSGAITTDFKLVSRVPSGEWAAAKQQALKILRENESPFFIRPAEILEYPDFELWQGTGAFGKEIRLLHANARLAVFTGFEAQDKNPAYKVTYMHVADVLKSCGVPVEFIAVTLNPADEMSCVSSPNLSIRSETLNRALADAEMLVATNGATSGLDRVHTVFQAYLRLLCKEANIPFKEEAPITALFQLIKEKHPRLQVTEPTAAKRMSEIHRGISRIVDAIGPVRNQSSLAHPNEVLLSEPEAMLVVNCVRTLLHYLNSRLR